MPGHEVWMEDPGYPPTRELIAHAQLRGVPIRGCRRHRCRTRGGTRARRASGDRDAVPPKPALRPWRYPGGWPCWTGHRATGPGSSKTTTTAAYRYASRPLPARKSLDRDGRVLYAGTFSKVLFPSVRLAYLVVPESQVERFEQISRAFSGGPPNLMQALVTAFMAEGHFARHIQRMRKLYAERRKSPPPAWPMSWASGCGSSPNPGGCISSCACEVRPARRPAGAAHARQRHGPTRAQPVGHRPRSGSGAAAQFHQRRHSGERSGASAGASWHRCRPS